LTPISIRRRQPQKPPANHPPQVTGNLDENSVAPTAVSFARRFMNTQVSAYLRGHFILHWKSVRLKAKIDHRLWRRPQTRTHYHRQQHPLHPRANGQVIDALPGLYGARESS
jgi:hypothetical protein